MPVKPKKTAVPEISKTMREALQMMLQSNMKSLYRWQGGCWATMPRPLSLGGCIPEQYIGTATIHAMLARGLVDVSQSRTSNGDSFPVEIRLNHLSYEALKCPTR